MYTLITLILLAFIAGVFAFFVWWCMGSPAGATGQPGAGAVTMGRIFSFVGVWVLARFDDYETKENARLAAILLPIYKELEKEIKDDKVLLAKHSVYEKNERRRRANPWKLAGACLPCFSWWVGVLSFAVFILFCYFPLDILLIFAPPLVSGFAVATMKLLQ